MTPTPATTAAIYEPDAGGASQALLDYALRKGWKAAEYRERPGTRKQRPVFKQLMYDAWRHKFDVVLVGTLEGFACSIADLSASVTRLHELGIRFVTMDKSIETDRGPGRAGAFSTL